MKFLDWIFGPVYPPKYCTDNLSTTPPKVVPYGTPLPTEDIDD